MYKAVFTLPFLSLLMACSSMPKQQPGLSAETVKGVIVLSAEALPSAQRRLGWDCKALLTRDFRGHQDHRCQDDSLVHGGDEDAWNSDIPAPARTLKASKGRILIERIHGAP